MDLQDLTWPAVAALDRDTPIVFPVAALEQHGHHLPVFTDSLLLGEVLRRAKPLVRGNVLYAPLTWLGNSHHHMDFAGTLSAEPRVFLDSLCGLVENALHHGFRRVLILNGHGGNIVPAQQAMFEVRQRHRTRTDLLLLSATYWTVGADPVREVSGLHQPEMGHACEWETSMILSLAPHLVVGDVSKVPDVPFGLGFEPAHRAWVMPDRSEPGHIGSPRHASAEKGDALFDCFARAVAGLLDRIVAWDGKSWDT